MCDLRVREAYESYCSKGTEVCDLRVREAYESYCSKGIERCVILGSGRHMRVTAAKE